MTLPSLEELATQEYVRWTRVHSDREGQTPSLDARWLDEVVFVLQRRPVVSLYKFVLQADNHGDQSSPHVIAAVQSVVETLNRHHLFAAPYAYGWSRNPSVQGFHVAFEQQHLPQGQWLETEDLTKYTIYANPAHMLKLYHLL